MLKLNITKRDSKESLLRLRKADFIPAVFYGKKAPATSISVNAKEFNQVFKQAGESTVISLDLAGETHNVLIHDLTRDAISGEVIHIDFYVIEKGAKVEVSIPLEFLGAAPAEKLGGALIKVLHEIEIKAEADKIPHSLPVDLSSLVDFEARILVKDIKLSAGVELITAGEEVVALVSEAREEVEEAPVDVSNIELSVERGKKEEEAAPETK